MISNGKVSHTIHSRWPGNVISHFSVLLSRRTCSVTVVAVIACRFHSVALKLPRWVVHWPVAAVHAMMMLDFSDLSGGLHADIFPATVP